MSELLTAAQMRAIEAAAIASGAVTGLELMERAGMGVVEAIFAEWPELAKAPQRAVVLCGPGNNGGDGFVVARLLKDRGWAVEVFLYGEPSILPPDARANCERWTATGEVRPLKDLNDRVAGRPGLAVDLVVDAFFGTGLARSLPDEVSNTFRDLFRRHLNVRVVAVDIPSGLCADSGRPLVPADRVSVVGKPWPALDGLVAEAALTVTFHRRKAGHVLGDGPRHCGKVVVKDIGLKATGNVAGNPRDAAPGRVRRHLKKRVGSHKYSHGHVLILSGPSGRGGAARLAARGALRIGAGLVTLGCPEGAMTENAARLDAIMLREVEDGEALGERLADRRINALCLGPGLGLDARAEGLVASALRWHLPDGLPLIDASDAQVERWMRQHGHRPACVLDADALTLLARDPSLMAMLHPACILTPHAGEFARLFPDIAAKLAAPATTGPACSKVDATRAAAARAGCTVLFKGPDTVIADPQGNAAISAAQYDRAAPWLATAGAGDVLSGMIAGLLARGFGPMDAAEIAAWLHVEAARSFGPGLIAEDLPEELPRVFRMLGL